MQIPLCKTLPASQFNVLDLKCHIPAGPRVACAEGLQHTSQVAEQQAHGMLTSMEGACGPLPKELGDGSRKLVLVVGHVM